jgi:hypothetical protein
VAVETEHFRAAGFDWKARCGARPVVGALCRALDDPGRLEGSVCVKDSAARSVWRVCLDGQTVYVKRYRVRGWAERLKYALLAPRAEAEWRAAVALNEREIEAAQPLAVGVARRGPWLVDAFFIAAEAPGVPYATLLHSLRARDGDATPLLRATVDLYERLCAAGIDHPDLHGGNMLARLEDETPRIALVDLHSIRLPRRFAPRPCARMRAKLAHSLWRLLSDAEFEFVLKGLAPSDARALRRRVERLERIRLRSRSRRCVLPSTRFARERAGGWTIWRRREVERAALLELVARSGAAPRRVEHLAIGTQTREVCVGRRARPSWLSLWKGLHALSVREIPTWRAYACMQRRRFGLLREAVLVVEHLPDAIALDHADCAWIDPALRRAALETAVRLHRSGLGARAEDLFAVRADSGWRVLRSAVLGPIPDHPIDPARAARERAELLARADSSQPTASR